LPFYKYIWLLLLISLLAVITALPAQAAGSTYYVSSSSGNDSNTGLSDTSPLETIAAVNALNLQPGDTVLFKCGDTWRGEMLHIEDSGTDGNPITFGSYPTRDCTDKPALSGAQPIRDWTLHSGNIYKADLATGDNAGKFGYGINQLTQNDSRLPFGRWPNLTQFDHGYSTIDAQPAANQLTDNALPVGDWAGAMVHIKGMRWYILNRQVTGDSGSTLTLGAAADCWGGDCTGWGYWLNNHLATLDSEGEWYFDAASSTVYLYTTGGTPADDTLEETVILLDDTRSWGGIMLGRDLNEEISYVVIDNLAVKSWWRHGIATPTNLAVYENSHLTLKNNLIQNVERVGINLATWVWNADSVGGNNGWRGGNNLLIQNNVIDGANQRGIDSYAKESLFEGNTLKNIGLIENLGAGGMGCDVDDSGGFCTEDGDGIRLKVGNAADSGHSNTLRYNRLEKIGYNGIDIFGHSNTLEYNVIEQACYAKGDCGAVRTFGSGSLTTTPVYDLVLRQNILLDTSGNTDGAHSTYAPLFGMGFYIDHYSRNVTLTGNTVISATIDGALYQNSTGQMTGNTFYNNNIGSMFRGQVNIGGSPSQVAQFSSNVLYAGHDNARTLIAASKERLTVSNQNYFFNPYLSPHIFAEGAKTLADWQSYSGLDGTSTEQWFSLNPGDTPKSRIFYNDTQSSQTFPFNGVKYLDLDQTPMTTSMTLAPFTSRVLVEGARPLSVERLIFVDSSSPAQSVILTNTGSEPLTISSISIAPAGDFVIDSETCPDSLPADADCSISVRYVGSAPATATLSISHNGDGSPYTVALAGGLLKTYLPLVLK
jgi:hypothetical protein